MIEKVVADVFRLIIEQNSKLDKDAIPHSDVFISKAVSSIGVGRPDIQRAIMLLKESHKIFTIEVIKEDKGKEIKKIEGYVEADIKTINKLKFIFQKSLINEYQKIHNKRLGFYEIVKEIYSKIERYKNTAIGQTANKAIMLEEYEKLIEKVEYEFTSEWKEAKLKEISESAETISKNKENETTVDEKIDKNKSEKGLSSSSRAVDSDLYVDYSSAKSKQSLDKVLQIYGLEFFFRASLRKYDFDLIIQVIESGQINRKSDLSLLKKMLQKVKSNFNRDPKLLDYTDKIYKLERTISRCIYFTK